MKLPKINKTGFVYGIGAGTSVVVAWSLRTYIDSDPITYPPLFAGPLGKYGTLIPLVSGSVAIVAALFMKQAKPNVKSFLGMFGGISVLSAVLNIVADTSLGMGARARVPVSQGVTRSRLMNGTFTPTIATSNRQADWVKAKGFGSDPSKLPDAQIKTKITKQVVYS